VIEFGTRALTSACRSTCTRVKTGAAHLPTATPWSGLDEPS